MTPFVTFELYETGQHIAVKRDQVLSFAEDGPNSTRIAFECPVHWNIKHREYYALVKGSFGEILRQVSA